MARGWLRRLFGGGDAGTKPPREDDPLLAWDGLIEDLERQGAQVRQSAATLLALRAELERDRQRYEAQLQSVRERLVQAEAEDNAGAHRALVRDEEATLRLLEATEQSWAQAKSDADVLREVASDIAQRLVELRTERQSARARLASGQVVTKTLRERVERLDRALALDRARDEVERAHQLAQIYREEQGREGPLR